ncbi:nucleotidyltransferase domain-containing protein [Methylotenera sp. L2L1]|uniref:nucleotidyltransferase domain-containing protein n=1 Tax=Methylotenera sp. L2L1 TaxID=1502770 RepID=UPI0005660431|nr:nucleotidyltransferase [Methylotenera sp. L2L1]
MNFDTNIALLNTRKKQMVVSLLDQLCQQLDITETQYQTAKDRYEAVGIWLADSPLQALNDAKIYPQGSIALGTAIKPIGSNEFDVDLVCYLPGLAVNSYPHQVKALIGSRLKEHGTYRGMLEEKQRCWRINYANEFHLDITPSIDNPHCYQGGELVPDKKLAEWKPTNPKGYIKKIEEYSALNPHFNLLEKSFAEARADIAPLPEQSMTKPVLKRIIQLLKRHRDHMFTISNRTELAPISVIITTLASWAYAECVTQRLHTNAFDFIIGVIREMPSFIKTEMRFGQKYFIIENETTSGENFADKWNHDSRLATAFNEWHKDALTSIESLLMIEGIDRFAESLSHKFGAKKELVRETLASINKPINEARTAGSLIIAPALGLTSAPALGSVTVPKNTFFGR